MRERGQLCKNGLKKVYSEKPFFECKNCVSFILLLMTILRIYPILPFVYLIPFFRLNILSHFAI